MERPADVAARGTASTLRADVVKVGSVVLSLAREVGRSEGGDSRTVAQATAARVAAAPIRTTVFGWRAPMGRVSTRPTERTAISLGWRHSRSSGSIQPRVPGSDPKENWPESSRSGPSSGGSSGGGVTH
jgi:hypothetical protein